MFTAWCLVIMAVVLLAMAIAREVRNHKDRQFIARVEAAIGCPAPRNQMRLTEAQLADMHRSRWEGD
jgi:hypothetical protein